MNIFSIPPFIISLFQIALGVIVYTRNQKNILNRLFALLCFVSSMWLLFYSFGYGRGNSEQNADLFFRIGYTGVIFIAVIAFHYTLKFLRVQNIQLLIISAYFLGMIWVSLLWASHLLIDKVRLYSWGYYPQAGILHPLFLVFFIGIASTISTMLFYFFWKKRDQLSTRQISQIKYLFLALFVYNFASVDFLPNYGLEIYPLGYLPAFIFLIVIGYTIIRYRLMDISLAITRTSIFIATYSLILGIPFALAFGYQERLISALGKNWWMVPLISSTVLATAGPFIYLFIQKRAEDRLLQEQRRYQMTLRQASSGMSKIKDLKKLLRMIVHIVTRTVHLEHSQVYLYDSTDKKFFLEATRNKGATKPSAVISIDSPLIRYLFGMREPIVYEEIKQRTQDYSDAELSQVEENLRQLDAAVVIPSFVENKLLAIIVLGKKLSGKLYSEDDLAVFSILANQAALAIENAQFYEDIKRTQEQLFQAEKMATIGTMADGLSHQINNRLHALGFIAGDALDTIRLKKEIKTPEEAQSILADLERSLTRIQDNVKQGGEVVQGLLKYTRKGEAGFSPVDFSQLLTASIEMAGYKVKLDQISIVKDFSEDIPKILGNFTQLQEVFFNLIDNAYDAMMQRKVEQKEPDYKGKINISARRLEGKIEIGVLDNGIGVKDEDSRKLFTPFFTTKLSSKKGTGLGLYVIQKIIEDNHGGKVSMSSEYMTGTLVTILLPTVN